MNKYLTVQNLITYWKIWPVGANNRPNPPEYIDQS